MKAVYFVCVASINIPVIHFAAIRQELDEKAALPSIVFLLINLEVSTMISLKV